MDPLDLRSCDGGLDAYLQRCPSRNVLDSISDKWTTLAMSALGAGTLRYGELKRRLEGVSPKMLSQTLRRLERDGLVERTQYPTIPPRVTYQLTPLGTRLSELLAQIKSWSESNYPSIQAAQAAFDARPTPTPH